MFIYVLIEVIYRHLKYDLNQFYFELCYRSSSCVRAELSGEVGPSGCHLWYSFISKIKMMSLLIILDSICFKDWVSVVGVISKFASSCTLEIGCITSKFIMSCYLIQSILITKGSIVLIIGSVSRFLTFFIKSFLLFSFEILTPTSRMVPMT